ncbi:MAG: efflux system, outer rane lipoprotein NodT family, partial [Polaromonas sp.]|nr:efflux system, outer rane lipoprotein NodT family [Polaromonas sp.]
MTNKLQTACAERRAQAGTELACIPGQTAMPVWRASVRMALVSAAGVVAAGLIATGIGGCADMSGIAPQA